MNYTENSSYETFSDYLDKCCLYFLTNRIFRHKSFLRKNTYDLFFVNYQKHEFRKIHNISDRQVKPYYRDLTLNSYDDWVYKKYACDIPVISYEFVAT